MTLDASLTTDWSAAGEAGLDGQAPGVVLVGVERVGDTHGPEPGGLYGLLRVHAEHEGVQDELDVGLGLVIALNRNKPGVGVADLTKLKW